MKIVEFIKVKIVAALIFLTGISISFMCILKNVTLAKENDIRDTIEAHLSVDKSRLTKMMVDIMYEHAYKRAETLSQMSPLEYFFSENYFKMHLTDVILGIIIPLIVALVFYAFYYNQALVITENEIKGKAMRGKEVKLQFNEIKEIKKNLFAGITIKTDNRNTFYFHWIKKRSEVLDFIPLPKGDRKEKNELKETSGVADELRKLKGLLDEGIISEEEFEQRKRKELDR